MNPYAWAEMVKAEIDRLQERCKNRKRVEVSLRELAEYAEQEANFVRDYEIDDQD